MSDDEPRYDFVDYRGPEDGYRGISREDESLEGESFEVSQARIKYGDSSWEGFTLKNIIPVTPWEKNMITEHELVNWFTYHVPDETQQKKYSEIRTSALGFAAVILKNTPSCADQTAAIRKVREAVMTANAAIACEGK